MKGKYYKKNHQDVTDKQADEGTLMRSPLWILNSTLALLFIVSLGLMFLLRTQLPGRRSLTPQAILPLNQDVSKINITRIYENDLFGTHSRRFKPTPQQKTPKINIPRPPQTKILGQRPQISPEFFTAS